jgi:hypothetical protein
MVSVAAATGLTTVTLLASAAAGVLRPAGARGESLAWAGRRPAGRLALLCAVWLAGAFAQVTDQAHDVVGNEQRDCCHKPWRPRREVARRGPRLAITGPEVDDLACQAAAGALLATTGRSASSVVRTASAREAQWRDLAAALGRRQPGLATAPSVDGR